jgi:polar amino acid transport system substrate-binding protein
MDEMTAFEQRLAAALEREVGPRRPVDALAIATRARATRPRHDRWPIPSLGHRAVRHGRSSSARRRTPILVAASLLLGGAALAAVGAWLASDRDPDLRTRVREAGVARIAVRPDSPQVVGPTIGLAGFDVDVAVELGKRLGLQVDIQPVAATDMLSAVADPGLDLLLPSTGTGAIDPARFARSIPYYWWPHSLVVSAASGRSAIGDLAGQAICAVAGDMGETWLRGESGQMPIDGSVIVTRSSDAECLTALADGEVAAMVTARMGPADLAARPVLVVQPGPPAEPRVIAAALASQPGSLLAEVDTALGGMLADGTLTRLSQSRFGGYDLTRSPAE